MILLLLLYAFVLVMTKEFVLQEFAEEQNNGTSYNDMNFISKNGHPKELFLSSDPHALVEHTKKVLVIEDSEVVDIKVHILLVGGILYSIVYRNTSHCCILHIYLLCLGSFTSDLFPNAC